MDDENATTVVKLDVTKGALKRITDFLAANPGFKQKYVIAAAVELFASLDPAGQFAVLSKDESARREFAVQALRKIAGEADPAALRKVARSIEPDAAVDAITALAAELSTQLQAARSTIEELKKRKG